MKVSCNLKYPHKKALWSEHMAHFVWAVSRVFQLLRGGWIWTCFDLVSNIKRLLVNFSSALTGRINQPCKDTDFSERLERGILGSVVGAWFAGVEWSTWKGWGKKGTSSWAPFTPLVTRPTGWVWPRNHPQWPVILSGSIWGLLHTNLGMKVEVKEKEMGFLCRWVEEGRSGGVLGFFFFPCEFFMVFLSRRVICCLIRRCNSRVPGFLLQKRRFSPLVYLQASALNLPSESGIWVIIYLKRRRSETTVGLVQQDLSFSRVGSFEAASLSRTLTALWLTASRGAGRHRGVACLVQSPVGSALCSATSHQWHLACLKEYWEGLQSPLLGPACKQV